jgi:hypothetical protein
MRLIHTTTLQLKEFFEPDIPPYAILSHTWGNEEVLFQEMEKEETSTKQGLKKIQNFCAEAKRHGYEYGWVDTCCIDKSSSSELSEAINSMYRWYKEAKVCYTYLADVPKPSDINDKDWLDVLAKSRWFTRGWTLQELIAPRKLVFYSDAWEVIGKKGKLRGHISKITGIHKEVLEDGVLKDVSVAEKMSWASKRTTTRPEDIAYCLLGIFGVNMTLLYGEREGAFFRLQRQMVEELYDQSLFAWEMSEPDDDLLEGRPRGLFAPSPANFVNSSKVYKTGDLYGPYSMHNMGLQIRLPLIHDTGTPLECTAVLSCKMDGAESGSRVAIRLMTPPQKRNLTQRLRARILGSGVGGSDTRFFVRDGSINPFIVGSKECKGAVVETIYILGSRWDVEDRSWD